MVARRSFLAGLLATALPAPGWAAAGSPAYLAAGKSGDTFELHGLSDTGQSLFRIALPNRGHAAAAHPTLPQAVAFARRPGIFALVIDCVTGAVLHRLTPPDGRQFNGHGAFSADGTLLMTSEVIAETSQGRIGLWDTASYARVDEWTSHGIGPHEIKRLPDGHIIVANGGIQTDPQDRSKLNLGTMRPNLSLLSPEGTLLDQADTPQPQNSIRHLALLPDNTIAFAMQWEGGASEPVPQLGLWTPGTAPRLCPPQPEEAFAMQGYAGSIAVSTSGDLIGVTSAKGGVVMLFDANGTPVATHRRADISGIAPSPDGLIVSDGQGAVWSCTAKALTLLDRHPVLWDNHLIAIG